MKNSVRRITDGAMISALMGLLIVLDGQTGMLLDGILFWFIPIPIIVYVVKYDVSSGLIISVAVTLLAFMISLPHIAMLVGFSSLIGLAYGFGIQKNIGTFKTLLLTFIVTFIYYILSMIIFAGFFGYDAVAELNLLIEFFSSMFGGFAGGEANTINILRWSNPFFAMLIMFVPFLPAVISVLQTIITHIFSSMILRRLKLAEIEIKPFYTITVSKQVGIVALVVMALTYVYFFSNINSYDSVIIVVQFACQLIFIVMGVIFSMTVAVVKQKPLLSVLVGLFTLMFPLVMMAIGIIDVFTNARMDMIRRSVNERES